MKHLYINGQWIEGLGDERPIINPATEEIITMSKDATSEQATKAILAAKRAFNETDWSTNSAKRVSTLRQLADLVEESKHSLAEIESENTGKPLRESEIDVEDVAGCLRYYADLIEESKPFEKTMTDGTVSRVVQEPIGVCGLIVPWNFPLLLGMWKLAPALAAGNAVVFKPSELTPLSILKLTELLEQTDMPKGIFNLLTGDGKVGAALVESDLVEKISFTGSSETGKRINEQCASTFKRVSLELGGKSPLVILADADIEKSAEWAAYGAFFNQGEVCVASSRILVAKEIYEEFLTKLVANVAQIKIGSPFEAHTELGALISQKHLEKVESYLLMGIEEGAHIVCGGKRLQRQGYFLEPTILSNVKQNMRIVQEEIFGPVVTIQAFEDEAEAIKLANDTKFGLAAGVLSSDVKKAKKLASSIKAGTIWINSYHTPYIEAPWGGFKQSGIGRELGPHGLLAFTETKHINESTSLETLGWYQFSH